MDFLSLPFLSLFAGLVVLHQAFPRVWQNRLILLTSFLFLASWGMVTTGMHYGLALVNFFTARKIFTLPPTAPRRRGLLVASVLLQLGVLIFFKARADYFHLRPEITESMVTLLPLGLSFYLLQMLGYTLEVYWRRIEPARGLSEFLLFTSFFPLLPMGPIERFVHLAPQFRKVRSLDSVRLVRAGLLLALGIFKKLAIADPLVHFVNHLDATTDGIHGFGLILYCFLGFIQLYADFSGFIDIARGLAMLLGIELFPNFDRPYLAKNISEVWYRWHMTLITWLRDFVYFPLLLATRNVYLAGAVVIFLAALWHELTLNYLLWALYWILLMNAHSLLRKLYPSPLRFGRAISLLLVSLSTLCFMARSWSMIPELLLRLLSLRPASLASIVSKTVLSPRELVYAALSIALMMVAEHLQIVWCKNYRSRGFLLILGLIFFTAALGHSNARAFIYLRY